MSENPITPEQHPIDKPDLDNLDPWLEKYITKPFSGMEDKTHPDGTLFTKEGALEATREQLRMVIRERSETLAFHNLKKEKKGLPLITKEANDQQLILNLLKTASEQRRLK